MKKFIQSKSFILVILILLLISTLYSCAALHQCAYDNWKILQDASFSNEGLEEGVCSCGKKESRIIPALGADGVSSLLDGTIWKGKNSYSGTYDVQVGFDNKKFNVTVNGVSLFSGSYTVTSDQIKCIEDGKLIAVYKYHIKDGSIILITDNGQSLIQIK